MKKKSLAFGALFIFIVLSSFNVLAQRIDLQQGARQLIQWIQDTFGPFFEVLLGVSQFDDLFFSRVLLLILLFVIILVVLKKIDLFRRTPAVIPLIAAIVSILGVRFLPETDFINAILLPYGTVAIALTVLLPFLIYFYFVHEGMGSGTGRRIAWILFAAVFVGMWITRADDVGEASWIYWIGIVLVGVSFIFDGKIHEYFGITEARKLRRERIKHQIADLEVELDRMYKIANPSDLMKGKIKDFEYRLKELYRKL